MASSQGYSKTRYMPCPHYQYCGYMYQLRTLAKSLQVVIYCYHSQAKQTSLRQPQAFPTHCPPKHSQKAHQEDHCQQTLIPCC